MNTISLLGNRDPFPAHPTDPLRVQAIGHHPLEQIYPPLSWAKGEHSGRWGRAG